MSQVFPTIAFMLLTSKELGEDRAWWEIYEESFPSSEREPREVILRSINEEAGIAVAARHANRTVGLATTHLLTDPPAVFLVYLALAREWRSRGVGPGLLDYAWRASTTKLCERGLNALGLIWEVKSTQDCSTQERQQRQRRINFFRRCGGEILPTKYLQPPVDGIAPVPMDLMFRPAAVSGRPDDAEIERLVRAIYFQKYGTVNKIPHAFLETLLKTSQGMVN